MTRQVVDQFGVTLEIIRGDTFTRTFTWGQDTDNDNVINTPYDVTAYEATLVVHDYNGNVILTLDNTYFVNGGAAGTFALTIPDDETDALTWTVPYAWYLRVSNGTQTKTLCGGIISLREDA